MTVVDYGPDVAALRRRLEAAEAEVARLRAETAAADRHARDLRALELDAQVLAAWKARGPGEPALMRVSLDPGVEAVTVLGRVGDYVVHGMLTFGDASWLHSLSHGPTGYRCRSHDSVESLLRLACALLAAPSFVRWNEAPKAEMLPIIEAWDTEVPRG